MATTLVRTRLFLGAYAPLLFLLSVRFTRPADRWTFFALSMATFLSLFWLLWTAERRVEGDPVTIVSVQDIGGEVAGFMATYLLPFLTVPEPTFADFMAYAVFLAIVGVIYVRSDMMQINPTVYLLGRQISAITTSSGSGFLVAPKRAAPGQTIHKVNLANNVIVALDKDS